MDCPSRPRAPASMTTTRDGPAETPASAASRRGPGIQTSSRFLLGRRWVATERVGIVLQRLRVGAPPGIELARPSLQAAERLPLERQKVRPSELASTDHRSLLEHSDVLVDRRQ